MNITEIQVWVARISPPGRPEPTDQRIRLLTGDYYVLDEPLSVIYSSKFETVFVKVCTNEGICGWGEVLAPTNPEVPAELIRGALGPLLIGKNPLDNTLLWDQMLNMFRVRGYTGGFLMDAMAGLDMAFWDIKGKSVGLPAYRLMGGAYNLPVPVYLSNLPGASNAERMERIREGYEQGYRAFKVHKVPGGWRGAGEMLSLARSEFSPDKAELMHDGHWRYTYGDACRLGALMDTLNAQFLECPLPPEQMELHAKLANSIRTPVAVGESMRGIYEFGSWIRAGAACLIQPDIGRNGISEMLRISAVAEASGLMLSPHLSVHQLVGVAASAHLSAAIPNLYRMEYQPHAVRAAQQYSSWDFSVRDGGLHFGDAPGLGVDIDEKLLAAHSITFTVKATGAGGSAI